MGRMTWSIRPCVVKDFDYWLAPQIPCDFHRLLLMSKTAAPMLAMLMKALQLRREQLQCPE